MASVASVLCRLLTQSASVFTLGHCALLGTAARSNKWAAAPNGSPNPLLTSRLSRDSDTARGIC